MTSINVFDIENVTPLRNEEYYTFIWNKLSNAKSKIWVAAFIASVSTVFDKELKVRNLLKLLSKKSLSVDTRILVSNSDSPTINIGNELTIDYMKSLDIDVRVFSPVGRKKSLHSKYVIIDNQLIVVGSHNWSGGGFGENIEDSIAVYSSELANVLSNEFLFHWQNSKTQEL